ncbi:hypothetical protein PDG61_20710 [Mycolicibacterium sp. BiH015]|uniref:TetR/AcrR family transcriptional regulator n=1 Tax=Mycolicibacterium sp. BiH015 TaxID=3018808 RepID=UPI0022E2400B|nr:hypothetical protein [Mycolicibacterium sp. BiH015]MDA2893348.1 hypothetical protein [Mycolicibacterium sp. BiH015]
MSESRGTSTGSRRSAIADAAIAVLATSGSRGLTHRAIDRQLGLAEGSTSAYLRTRASLFIAATARLAELDRAALDDLHRRLRAGGVDITPAHVVAAIVDDWTTPQAAPRQLARIELQLEATRNPEVAEALATQRLTFLGLAHTTLRAWRDADGVQNADPPDAVAGVLIALVDGLIADRLLHNRTAVPAQQLTQALDELLRVPGSTAAMTVTPRLPAASDPT